jgi:hypothetical protein
VSILGGSQRIDRLRKRHANDEAIIDALSAYRMSAAAGDFTDDGRALQTLPFALRAREIHIQTDASVGSDIVTQFFTLGRSCILAYQP